MVGDSPGGAQGQALINRPPRSTPGRWGDGRLELMSPDCGKGSAMAVEVGDSAPDFELTDQHGAPVKLSNFRGKKVILVFYPLAFSGVCQGELCEIRDELPSFGDDGTQILTVSVDSMFSHRAWAEQQGY